MTLTVNKIPRARKFKFGVYAGKSCITSHKTEEEANNALINSASFYEYWAGSVSVSVNNSDKKIVAV